MDLEQLIKLSKAVARPYVWAVGILSILLFGSICGNIYQATKERNITIEQENIESNDNINGIIE